MNNSGNKKSDHALEFLATAMEAIEDNVVGSKPPGDGWISIADQLPGHDQMVEVWNSGMDQVEAAFFDTTTKRWVSPSPVIVYMFGEITHWREKVQVP